MKLSAIIIAKNEEKNLEVCLQSMTNVFEDVVVIVDSSTTDKTFEVAAKYPNVNCELFEWQGYAKTKSYAVSKTKHDWVF
ncbi:MAG: glycosyltransferase, partial [Ignavibacteria bacterium]|nr:glycosyltransferase [Ignavibacteria bacterium]